MFTLHPFDHAAHVCKRVAIDNANKTGSSDEQDEVARYANYFSQDHLAYDLYAPVAVDDAGDVIGYPHLYHGAGQESGRYNLQVVMHPAQRRQGVDMAPYSDVLQSAQDHVARMFHTGVADEDEVSIAFAPGCRGCAKRRGFEQKAHLFGSARDLTIFGESAFPDVLDARTWLPQGLRFTSMAELGETTDARCNRHQINTSSVHDIPGDIGEHAPLFEDFERDICHQPWYRPPGQRVVVEPESGAFMSMSAVSVNTDDHAYNLHTDVAQVWRGRKLAQAVKRDCIRFASANGATRIGTDNDSRNLAMLAINTKFGYVRHAGHSQFTRAV